ncbi:TIGR03619 family F420-dependent LLM class oxidoreductase [Georgenia thermotolerans]|uniref:TIGR03619 family F420-dependent LLM class oxidoreductase n=1 Tax=Georgenia thermotolerans TaxID=527326 RepID=A0A7J5UTF6_9MICO|nr:TIGR03619 family F420-dependent LLM class oxidoreductase [Georgenia thermotolerans]KAE8765558.1 TIGR03619 family F420-dependent LLM class oxidoreductase [Georgenia thermotolerans]
MDIGFALPVSGAWATPDNIATVARRAEELGYASLWTFQRLLDPERRRLPPVYASVLDPVVALGFAAAVTERVRLGTAIVNMPFVAPVLLAKQMATLDVLSGGRLDVGLGLGWEPEEFEAAGTPMERRGARAEEYLACLRALWGPDPVEFNGEFYRVPRSDVRPKPVQRPTPPLLLGASAPRALARVGRLADGWISSSRADPAALGESIEQVRAGARAAGREPDRLRFVCRGVVRDAPRTAALTGSLEEVRADLPALAAQGVTEVFVDLNFDPTVGNPDADPAASMRRAHAVLEALAPRA